MESNITRLKLLTSFNSLKRVFIILFLITNVCASVAQNDVEFSDELLDVSIYQDPDATYNAEGVLAINKFEEYAKNSVLNLGVSKSVFWIRFDLKNNFVQDINRLVVENSNLKVCELYEVRDGLPMLIGKAGTQYDRGSKKSNQRFLSFVPELKSGELKSYLLRVEGTTQLLIPISYGSAIGVSNHLAVSEMIFAVYVGIILVMLLYNLFIYLTVRDKNYLHYTVYLLLALFAQLAINGYGYLHIWGKLPAFEEVSITVFSALGGAAAIRFMQVFLGAKKRIPKLNYGLSFFIGLFFVSVLLAFFNFKIVAFVIMQNVTILASLFVFVSSLIIMAKGYRPARFFVVAWTILLIGAIAFVLRDFGVLSYNYITSNALIASQALEMILLSFALADKINTYRQEIIKAIKEKEQILEEQNVMLESEVKARTSELNDKNVVLNQAMVELKDTQAQLVQSEKMSSLGQLTAGIAHEINNPMNYAQQSISTIKRDIQDIRELLVLYETLEIKKDNVDALLKEIIELKEDIEYEELHTEIDEAIEDVNDGIRRAVEIASELKTFSRIDQADVKLADVEKGMNSTLELMKSEFSNFGIELIKEYDNLPMIECWASKLNQVFMNILNNSVYAIVNGENPKAGKILVSTKMNEKSNEVIISISDNGMGMSSETMSKIFDPFYTTKEVGSGSGLGMSISHGIVNEHGGRLSVESTLNQGSNISIILPMKLELTGS